MIAAEVEAHHWNPSPRNNAPVRSIYIINKGEIKILQTLHKSLHFLRISLILRTLHCVGFEAKILHKPYMQPYMGTKSQRDKETKSQRVKETKSQRD